MDSLRTVPHVARAVTPVTEKIARDRWAQFHYRIAGGRISLFSFAVMWALPAETKRFKAVRFLTTPLRAVLRARAARKRARLARAHAEAAQRFPIGFDGEAVTASFVGPKELVSNEEVAVVVDDFITSSAAPWYFFAKSTDRFEPAVLDTLLASAAQHPNANVVFGDHAEFDEHGTVVGYGLKAPSTNPIVLSSFDAVARPALVRASAWNDVVATLPDGVDQWRSFLLHEAQSSERMVHVPVVLALCTDFSASGNTEQSVAHYWTLRGTALRTYAGGRVATWSLATPMPAPLVDILIPTRDRLELLRACIDSVRSITTYPNYRITVLDNDSKEPATLQYLAESGVNVVPCPGPFNYAAIVNRGVAGTNGDVVITLNNDTTIETADWLERLVGLVTVPNVAVVGVNLSFPSGEWQHQGVTAVPFPQHICQGVNTPHDYPLLSATREVVAVTGACQAVRREVWQALQGYDENLAVVQNDIDFCFRALEAGYEIVVDAGIRLTHDESASRGSLNPIEDILGFLRRWDVLGDFRDPYFSPSVELLGKTLYWQPLPVS